MVRSRDLTGMVFGRLTVAQKAERETGSGAWWECACTCGATKVVQGKQLTSGKTNSCGCLAKEIASARFRALTKHGESKPLTPTYKVWRGMRARCNNPNMTGYLDYGGRGIKVCERWGSYENFLSDMGERPKGMSLDRIDNNGDYEPSNCRWVTPSQNNRNTRKSRMLTAFGKTLCVSDWADITGINRITLFKRIDAGWHPERALTMPANQGNRDEDRYLPIAA